MTSAEQGPDSTTVCYALSVTDQGPPGPPRPPAISHVTLGLFPNCTAPFPDFTVTVDATPIPQCPPEPTESCFEFPGPFPGEPDIFPALKVEFRPDGPGPGQSVTICVTVEGCRQLVLGLFQFKAGPGDSFPATNVPPEEQCQIVTISCEPCPPKGIPLV